MWQEYHQSEPRSICQGKQWVLLLLNMLGPAQRSTMPSLHVIKLVKFPPPDTVFLTPQSSFVDPTEEFFSAWRRKGFNRQPCDLIHLKEATDTGYNDVPPASVCVCLCDFTVLYLVLCSKFIYFSLKREVAFKVSAVFFP